MTPVRPNHTESVATFWIGTNPGSKRFPFVLRIPIPGEGRIFLAAIESWPRSKDVFCYQLDAWPEGAEIIQEVPVEAAWRVGTGLHLTLRRPRGRRSIFVWTKDRAGKTLIFWRSQTSLRAARPGIRVPEARGLERPIEIVADVAERYPWQFRTYDATIARRALPVGDYAVVRDDEIRAVVERKTPADLATAAISGQLMLALADLGKAPHAAVVIEGRLSDVLKIAEHGKRRAGWVLNVLAAIQVAHPMVMWMFAETPRLAEDWAYRWLAASIRLENRTPLDERDAQVLGQRPTQAELPLGPTVVDAAARRSLLAREAESGTIWTSRSAAEECRVAQPTAAADLKRLVTQGVLRVEGSGRSRTYRAVAPRMTLPNASR